MPDARFQPLPGFRDFAPEDCSIRNYLFDTWKSVAQRYGFSEYEAPTVEATELYLKKSGGELPTQLFRFQDQGDRDITLRPELTASLGRIAAAYQREYTKPLKWFEIGTCFRYEKPQKGRLREFYQFNADILGEPSAAADAELLALAIDAMRELGFRQGDFIVRVSDRQAWTDFASRHGVSSDDLPTFLGIIDKLERDHPDAIRAKLAPFNIDPAEVHAFIAEPPQGASSRFDELRANLACRGLEGFVQLDLSIVRGLAYYTGLVFEIFDSSRSLRAVAGGGRYDTLVAALSNNAVDLPATGFAMGDVVIRHFIEQTPHAKQRLDAWLDRGSCDLFVVIGDESRRANALGLVAALREAGIRCDFPLSPAKFPNQIQRAEKARAKFALIVGRDFPALELRHLPTRESSPVNLPDADLSNPESARTAYRAAAASLLSRIQP